MSRLRYLSIAVLGLLVIAFPLITQPSKARTEWDKDPAVTLSLYRMNKPGHVGRYNERIGIESLKIILILGLL